MRSARMTPAVWALVLAVFNAHAAPAQEPNAVLEEVRDRHRAALESIRTVTYSYQWQTLKSEPFRHKIAFSHPIGLGGGKSGVEVPVGEPDQTRYWQSPDVRRSRSLWSDGSTVDEVLRFGRVLRVRAPKPTDPDSRMEITLETQNVARLWDSGILFEHLDQDYHYTRFHDLLQQPHQLRRVERLPVTPDGKAGDICVELEHDVGVYEFWVSPRHNYLIRKRIEYPAIFSQHVNNDPADPFRYHSEEEVEFVEPNPGQFYPARIDFRSFEGRELRNHSRRTLSDVQLNRPIPAEAFRIPGIDGGWCEDLSAKAGFHVNADGYRIGKPQPNPVAADGVQPPRPTRTPPVSEEPVSLWVWLAIAFLAFCLCAALFEIRQLRTELKKKVAPDQTNSHSSTSS